MHPPKLRWYVNDFLLPELKIEKTISESTTVRWLKKLGFSKCRVQKGVYVDRHERDDVVKACTELINYLYTQVLPWVHSFIAYIYFLKLYARFSYSYEGENLIETAPTLQPSQKIHYPIFHDKTCVHANDLANFVWMREGEQPLRNKSHGQIVHVM